MYLIHLNSMNSVCLLSNRPLEFWQARCGWGRSPNSTDDAPGRSCVHTLDPRVIPIFSIKIWASKLIAGYCHQKSWDSNHGYLAHLILTVVTKSLWQPAAMSAPGVQLLYHRTLSVLLVLNPSDVRLIKSAKLDWKMHSFEPANLISRNPITLNDFSLAFNI